MVDTNITVDNYMDLPKYEYYEENSLKEIIKKPFKKVIAPLKKLTSKHYLTETDKSDSEKDLTSVLFGAKSNQASPDTHVKVRILSS